MRSFASGSAAVQAYREQGKRLGIDAPEIVCGISAHPALYKASMQYV